MPMTLDTNLFRGVDDLDQHPFDEQAHDGLALGLRRCVGAPERRQILRQIADRGQLGCRGSLLARALGALMLRLETGLFGQSLLPVALERARHQPVLGLHRSILPARALDLVSGALQPLSPMAIERRALGLEVVGERQARLDRRRLERLQDETRDQRVERRSRQRLTERLAVAALHLRADVAGGMAVVVVLRQHAQTAAAADQHAREKRASSPHRPAARRLVGLQLRLIALIALEADVAGQPIVQKDFGLVGARRSASRSRTAGLLPSPLDRTHAVSVDARIDRIGEEIEQGRATGAPPFQLALARAAAPAHRHADVVLDQVGHHLADRPEAIEQVEDQTDRRLRLLVGIEDDLARGTAHVADGHGFAEFAPTRLGFPARQHPCLEDMKLGFRHRSFQTQKEAIVVVGRIIHPVGVGDQRVEQRADLQKLMPIPAGARQPRHLHAEHEADLAEPDLGDQPLKAQASLDARAGASKIVVDDDDLLAQPAELRRPVREGILQSGQLLMALNLLRRGLADVDDRQTILMAPDNLVAGRADATLDKARIRHWNASVATVELRIRCKAICPRSVAMRPRRSRGSRVQIDAGRSLIAGSKPTRQGG